MYRQLEELASCCLLRISASFRKTNPRHSRIFLLLCIPHLLETIFHCKWSAILRIVYRLFTFGGNNATEQFQILAHRLQCKVKKTLNLLCQIYLDYIDRDTLCLRPLACTTTNPDMPESDSCMCQPPMIFSTQKGSYFNNPQQTTLLCKVCKTIVATKYGKKTNLFHHFKQKKHHQVQAGQEGTWGGDASNSLYAIQK